MSGRVTKGNGQATSAFRRLTRADLVTFDREATDLVLEAMQAGCVGRVSSRGHAILRNNAGGSVAVPRNMTSPNRTAQNARADVKRLLTGHRSGDTASTADRTPRGRAQMTVAAAFVQHPSAFSRWFDAQPQGLPADQLIEVSFEEACEPVFQAVPFDVPAQLIAREPDKPEPATVRRTHRRGHLMIAPEPGQEVEDDMTAQAREEAPFQAHAPDPAPEEASPEAVLERVRSALGEDPRVAALKLRISTLEAELADQTRRADDAEVRLGLIREAFHA
ncbi:hypothetical protein ACFVVC_02050 [Pseudarthrobacter sp. NPDC058196]|uniref:hypothetical protein n=1 Tax=Pseudarthrobacter sp. NPDC058196 TaxID=3346376 RepID=UPI0036DD4193